VHKLNLTNLVCTAKFTLSRKPKRHSTALTRRAKSLVSDFLLPFCLLCIIRNLKNNKSNSLGDSPSTRCKQSDYLAFSPTCPIGLFAFVAHVVGVDGPRQLNRLFEERARGVPYLSKRRDLFYHSQETNRVTCPLVLLQPVILDAHLHVLGNFGPKNQNRCHQVCDCRVNHPLVTQWASARIECQWSVLVLGLLAH